MVILAHIILYNLKIISSIILANFFVDLNNNNSDNLLLILIVTFLL